MKKDNSKLFLILGIVIALLAIIAGGAILYFCTDIFKTEQQLFLKYLGQTENLSQFIPEQTAKYSGVTKGTVTMDLTSTDQTVANQTIPPRNFSLEYTVNKNVLEDKDSTEAKLKYINNDLFTLKYVRNQDTYAIKSDEVINKYLAIENNNLKSLAAKYGVTDTTYIPNKIEPIDFKELMKLSEEQKQHIVTTYLPIIKKNIPKECYSKDEATITVDEKDILTKTYSLNITSTQIKNIFEGILNQLVQDDTTLNMILEKYTIIDSESNITIDDIKTQVQEMLDNIEITGEENNKITLYVNNEKVIRIEAMNAQGNMYVDFLENKIIITNNIEQNSDYVIDKIEISNEKYQDTQDFLIVIMANDAENNYTISLQNTVQTATENINKTMLLNVNISDTTYFTLNLNENTSITNNVDVPTLDNSNSAKVNEFTPEYTQQLIAAIGNRLQQLFLEKVSIIVQVQQQQAMVQSSNIMESTQNQQESITNTISQ